MLGLDGLIPGQENGNLNTVPGFTVSSLFPFFGGKLPDNEKVEPVYFWPKPLFRNEAAKNDAALEAGEAKKYKKIQYVDTAHFESYLSQQRFPAGGTDNLHGAFQSAVLPKGRHEFLTDEVQTRLRKPRDESAPEPYYIERLRFRYDSGLWCLVRYDSDESEQHVRAAIGLLEDFGLGTDRAVGNGQFRASFGHIDLDVPQTGPYATNLSLFCPESHDQLQTLMTITDSNTTAPDPAVRFELLRRGGWLSEPYNTLRKRSVQMFRAGSLLRLPDAKPFSTAGKLVNLMPLDDDKKPMLPHPVWRDGRALWLPVNLPTQWKL